MFAQKTNAHIPIVENIQDMSLDEINLIKSTGFCYVKIQGNEQLCKESDELRSIMINFFRSSTETKKSYTVRKASAKKIDKILISGYTDRRSVTENLEIFRQYISDDPYPPLNSIPGAVNNMSENFIKRLGIELSKKVLNSINIHSEVSKNYDAALENPVGILSYTYYSPGKFLNRLTSPAGINPHKDIDLLTVIILEKPGLEAWVDGEWVPLLPKAGYAVIIFGDDFTTLTKGQVRSCLHAVRTTEGRERLSTVYFISMDRSLPYVLIDGTKLSDTGSQYLDNRFLQHNVELRMCANSALSYCKSRLNFSYFLLYGLLCSKNLLSSDILLLNFRDNAKDFFKPLLLQGLVGFTLLNTLLKIFSITYFKRMILDFLQYSEEPNFASHGKREAYSLGKMSLNFFGMTHSFLNPVTYQYRSYWNAGFLTTFSDCLSDKEDVRKKMKKIIANLK